MNPDSSAFKNIAFNPVNREVSEVSEVIGNW